MKIYLAATAPGSERKGGKVGKILIPRRLLSYYLIKGNILHCKTIFKRLPK